MTGQHSAALCCDLLSSCFLHVRWLLLKQMLPSAVHCYALLQRTHNHCTKLTTCFLMQIHVKSVEKGHPLAALKAAGSSLASPLLFTANPSLLQPYSGPQGVNTPLQAYPQSQSWGAYNAADKHAPEGFTGYSSRDCRGLDSIGQALSAALQVHCLCPQGQTLQSQGTDFLKWLC